MDDFADFRDFVGGNIHGCRDVVEHGLGAFERNIFQQRAGNGLLRGVARTIFAGSQTRAHEGQTSFGHGGAHVCEVKVDQTFAHDNVGNTLDRIVQHFIGALQHFPERSLLAGEGQQAVVGNGNQTVHVLFEIFDTVFGGAAAFRAFKAEGLGHDAHGQRAQFLGGLRHHRRGAGTGTAAHAGGHKHHIGVANGFPNGIDAFQGSFAPHSRIGARAEALGQFFAQLHLERRAAAIQGLQIRIGADELHAAQLGIYHVLHGIAAASPNANNLDLGVACHGGVDIVNDGLRHGFLSL